MKLSAKLLKSSFLFSLGLLASAYGLSPQANAQSVGDRNIIIRLDEIQINDEDDDITNDEPYLVVIKFRFLYGSEASTLSVSTVRGGRNSLRGCCNWADEGNRYAIAPPHINEYVPGGEDVWVVGAAIVHMENDGFDRRATNILTSEIRDAVETGLRTMTRVDRKAIKEAVTERITARTHDALSRLDIGGIVRGLSAGADKDDQGGVYVVLGITFGGRVFGYVGAEQSKGTKYLTRATAVDDRKPLGFALDYPTAAINADKSAEQFRGHNIVRGRLIAGELRAPD